MDFKVAKVEIDDHVLEAFDQIMHCGSRGVHLLFSHDQIRRAFVHRDAMVALEDADSGIHLQEAIENLVTIVHVDEQQEFIDALEPELCDLLVHLYFGFLDRYLNSDAEEVPEVLH